MGREKGMRKGTQTSHGNFGNFTTTSLKAFTHGVRSIKAGAVADGRKLLSGGCCSQGITGGLWKGHLQCPDKGVLITKALISPEDLTETTLQTQLSSQPQSLLPDKEVWSLKTHFKAAKHFLCVLTTE